MKYECRVVWLCPTKKVGRVKTHTKLNVEANSEKDAVALAVKMARGLHNSHESIVLNVHTTRSKL